jgi:hypothetical protein
MAARQSTSTSKHEHRVRSRNGEEGLRQDSAQGEGIDLIIYVTTLLCSLTLFLQQLEGARYQSLFSPSNYHSRLFCSTLYPPCDSYHQDSHPRAIEFRLNLGSTGIVLRHETIWVYCPSECPPAHRKHRRGLLGIMKAERELAVKTFGVSVCKTPCPPIIRYSTVPAQRADVLTLRADRANRRGS